VASLKSLVEKRSEKLESLVADLRESMDEGDFGQMGEIADSIGNEADKLAAKLEEIEKALSGQEEDDTEEDNGEDEEPAKKKAKK
jgi:uncharacterized protein YpuA (DUF1002 family)